MSDSFGIFSLVNQKNWGMYSRPLAKALGLNVSVFLSELVRLGEKLSEDNRLVSYEGKDGWFYATIDHVEERTGLSRKEQDNAIAILKERGFIFTIVKGVPPKRYFLFNQEKSAELLDLLQGNSKKDYQIVQKGQIDLPSDFSNLSERDKLICPKGTNPIYSNRDLCIETNPGKEPEKQGLSGLVFSKEWEYLQSVEIPDKQKSTLMQNYSPQLVKRVLDAVTHPNFTIDKDLSSALFYYVKNPDHLPSKKEPVLASPRTEENDNEEIDRVLFNRQDAVKFADEFRSCPDFPVVSNGGGYIEFRHLRGFKIYFNDKNFDNKLDESMKSYKAYIEKVEKARERPHK